ncbi:MAG: threonine ammonia-lyase IlvA [Saprospiraceae bacterium]|nr:threonine ammonia-lyase IlvA [Saprospiraceae bacterium]
MTKKSDNSPLISIENIYKAKVRLKNISQRTPLMHNLNWSERYDCNMFFKREDLQVVRSYKIRGAYNKMCTLTKEALEKGVVCASAGNHAQGVALACKLLNVKGTIFMPSVTPKQKVSKVKFFGRENVEVMLTGDTYDASYQAAKEYTEGYDKIFIHPFDDEHVIEGQATVGLEIIEDCDLPIDYVFVAIGGGGLVSGLGSYFKQISPKTQIIGVEPLGAPAMHESLKREEVIALKQIDTFVDGAAVKKVGQKTFRITQKILDDLILVPEGKVCTTILQLYNEEAIVAEPAGAITIAALDFYKDKIKGKNVVCIISGGNNDITRMEEIKERSMLYEGLKHYFIIEFPQRAGALREFLNVVLSPTDDITHFQYIKKHNREAGPAIVGIELKEKSEYEELIKRMNNHGIRFQTLNDNPRLYELLV